MSSILLFYMAMTAPVVLLGLVLPWLAIREEINRAAPGGPASRWSIAARD